jgi:hypothetical protein
MPEGRGSESLQAVWTSRGDVHGYDQGKQGEWDVRNGRRVLGAKGSRARVGTSRSGVSWMTGEESRGMWSGNCLAGMEASVTVREGASLKGRYYSSGAPCVRRAGGSDSHKLLRSVMTRNDAG